MAYKEFNKRVKLRLRPWVINTIKVIVGLAIAVAFGLTVYKVFANVKESHFVEVQTLKTSLAQKTNEANRLATKVKELEKTVNELNVEKLKISTELKVKDKMVQQLLNKISELEKSRKVISVPDGSVLKIETQKPDGHDQ
jgi:septal ring factor EnvC (AmiA/AmiB activator)